MQLPITLYVHFKHFRQGVDHRHANTMEATGELVIVTIEFGARMKSSKDEFYPGQLLFLMYINRHAAPIVTYGH